MNSVQDSSERRLVLITMMIGTFMAALDSSIVNISLPAMAAQFQAPLIEIEWVVLSYLIGFAVSIPLTGWLKENLGFRWLYTGSLFVFVFGSALCGAAHSLDFLVVARVIQALGGGALTPTAMAILSTVFPPGERGRAIGLWGLGVVMGPAIGPTLGGLLTGQFGWPSVFYINIPVGLVGIYLATRTLKKPELSSRRRTRFDLVGFLSLSIFLTSLFLAVNEFGSSVSDVSNALLLWALVGASLLIFIFSAHRNPEPLLDLSIFSNQQFLNCVMVSISRSAALQGGMFLLPFLMQNVLKYSEVKSGLLMLPSSLLVGVLMPWSGQWADRNGARNITVAGIVLLSFSMFLLGLVSFDFTLLMILVAMVLRGIGLGLLATPISTATVNSVPQHQITLASSLNSLLQQCGGAIGVSVFALIHHKALSAASHLSPQAAESNALQLSFFTTGGAFLLALIPALRLSKAPPPRHKDTPDVVVE